MLSPPTRHRRASILFAVTVAVLVPVPISGGAENDGGPIRLGPLVCTDLSCPTAALGRTPNNTHFKLRDVMVMLGGDGVYYLTGTSTMAGDRFWTDAYGVVRVWRSASLTPGTFTGGAVVFNITRDCPQCSRACRTPNSCASCGGGAAGCATPDSSSCGARLWAPEIHYVPEKAAAVPRSGGYFITYHMHCTGGGSGVLKSTSGTPIGPFAPLVGGIPGGDTSLFRDPADGKVHVISSGSCLNAAELSADMTRIVRSKCLSPECGGTDCSKTAIGFEGPFMYYHNATRTYFLSSSAFGNATQHGGPSSVYNSANPPPGSHYSSYMGSAKALAGPYTDGRGNDGSWLAVDSGGHNNYFVSKEGALFATLWYGSDPGRNTPATDADLVDTSSMVECEVASGRVVAKYPSA